MCPWPAGFNCFPLYKSHVNINKLETLLKVFSKHLNISLFKQTCPHSGQKFAKEITKRKVGITFLLHPLLISTCSQSAEELQEENLILHRIWQIRLQPSEMQTAHTNTPTNPCKPSLKPPPSNMHIPKYFPMNPILKTGCG